MISIETLAAGIVTICIFSFLYRDNPLYRAAEHLLIGLSVGYVLVLLCAYVLTPKLLSPLFIDGDLWALIPMALSILMLLRIKSSLSYLSKPVLALIVGAGAGVSIPAMFDARILKQVAATITPFAAIAAAPETSFMMILEAVVGLVGCVTVMVYFFYTRPDTKLVRGISMTGVYFLMIFFGATFGYTVTSRLTLLIGRIEFLLGDFLHLL
ncbi:MAG: hypothetical protein WBP42_10665 [Candidatus Zixiibacteriota bacterium]